MDILQCVVGMLAPSMSNFSRADTLPDIHSAKFKERLLSMLESGLQYHEGRVKAKAAKTKKEFQECWDKMTSHVRLSLVKKPLVVQSEKMDENGDVKVTQYTLTADTWDGFLESDSVKAGIKTKDKVIGVAGIQRCYTFPIHAAILWMTARDGGNTYECPLFDVEVRVYGSVTEEIDENFLENSRRGLGVEKPAPWQTAVAVINGFIQYGWTQAVLSNMAMVGKRHLVQLYGRLAELAVAFPSLNLADSIRALGTKFSGIDKETLKRFLDERVALLTAKKLGKAKYAKAIDSEMEKGLSEGKAVKAIRMERIQIVFHQKCLETLELSKEGWEESIKHQLTLLAVRVRDYFKNPKAPAAGESAPAKALTKTEMSEKANSSGVEVVAQILEAATDSKAFDQAAAKINSLAVELNAITRSAAVDDKYGLLKFAREVAAKLDQDDMNAAEAAANEAAGS